MADIILGTKNMFCSSTSQANYGEGQALVFKNPIHNKPLSGITAHN